MHFKKFTKISSYYLFSQIIFLSLSFRAHAQPIFMAPNGEDSNKGTIDAPFQSFNRVLNEIRKNNDDMHEDIIIYLRGGTYFIDETIKIDESISGSNGFNIIFQAYENEKPVISGGKKIDDWELFEESIYRAYVGNIAFRQIYVNDKKAIRAREPNNCGYYTLDWDRSNKSIIVNRNDVESLEHSDPNNPVEIFIQKVFACQIFRLSEVDPPNNITPLSTESALQFVEEDTEVFIKRVHQIHDGQAYHLENSYEFLDSPNEWFLDKSDGYLYLYKPPYDNIEEVFVPQVETLLSITGSLEKSVENISFERITFEHSSWTLPDSIGLLAGQATYIYELGSKQPRNGGIVVENAENIGLTKNIIQNMGGSGIMFYSGVHDSRITGNVIKNIANSGIEIDRRWIKNHTNKKLLCSDILVNNNLVSNVGTDYFGAVGIYVGYADSVIIEHNLVYKVPYTGISVGWGWTLEETNLKNNEIRYNIVDSPLSLLSDGGAIYTLSRQPGTRIHHNIIENVRRSVYSNELPIAAIYLDNGSNYISVYENIFRNVEKGLNFNTRGGEDNDVRTNNKDTYKTLISAGLQADYRNILKEIPTDINCYDQYFAQNMHDKNEKIDLSVYPNPSDNYIYISDFNLLKSENFSYKIYNSTGALVQERETSKIKYQPAEIDIRLLSSGIYILEIMFENFVSDVKLIKK